LTSSACHHCLVQRPAKRRSVRLKNVQCFGFTNV